MKYEKAHDSHEMALCVLAAEVAGGRCEYSRPTLFVHPDMFAFAEGVANRLYYNLEADSDLKPAEWYVAWNGKAFGSLGC